MDIGLAGNPASAESDFSGLAKPSGAQIRRPPFNSTGGEYFRIWMVNLLLTAITLKIYFTSTRVRKAQCLHGTTSLAGTSSESHANPMAIFKGRAIARALVVSYQTAFVISKPHGFAAMADFRITMP